MEMPALSAAPFTVLAPMGQNVLLLQQVTSFLIRLLW